VLFHLSLFIRFPHCLFRFYICLLLSQEPSLLFPSQHIFLCAAFLILLSNHFRNALPYELTYLIKDLMFFQGYLIPISCFSSFNQVKHVPAYASKHHELVERKIGRNLEYLSFYFEEEKYIDWIAFPRLFNAPWSIRYGALKLGSNSIHLIFLRSVFLFLRLKYIGDWPIMFSFRERHEKNWEIVNFVH